jgi:hypothetical protein
MEHKQNLETYVNQSITIIEDVNLITISLCNNNIEERVSLTKKELHSFIGTLLHVQQKMK